MGTGWLPASYRILNGFVGPKWACSNDLLWAKQHSAANQARVYKPPLEQCLELTQQSKTVSTHKEWQAWGAHTSRRFVAARPTWKEAEWSRNGIALGRGNPNLTRKIDDQKAGEDGQKMPGSTRFPKAMGGHARVSNQSLWLVARLGSFRWLADLCWLAWGLDFWTLSYWCPSFNTFICMLHRNYKLAN